ncbi:MAG: hypothetical protein HYU36_07970 [Planctomycetes bacterium]|nr:hypothetical protein [Planctomycetota bacterium]
MNQHCWTARWTSGAHAGAFRLTGQFEGRALRLDGNLLEWTGPQPAFITGDAYFHSRLLLRFFDAAAGTHHPFEIDTHPVQLALGVRHERYLMVDEDTWYPPRNGFSTRIQLPPGAYQIGLEFKLFDASRLRPLLVEMLHDFRHADPFAEVRIMEYHHQVFQWHAARESRQIAAALEGVPLIVPGTFARAAVPEMARGEKKPQARPPPRSVKAGQNRLYPHRALSPWLKGDATGLDAALWLLEGRRSSWKRLEAQHETFNSRVWKSPWGRWCFGNQGDSLDLASRTLEDFWSAKLLGRWRYLRPHYRIWSTWPYTAAEKRVLWPRETPQLLAPRPWYENRAGGPIELSTTHRLAAAAVASWVCGRRFNDAALERKASGTILGWLLPRQEPDGFWHYTPDRWPGQEGFHCEVVSHLAALLEFDEWRRCRPLLEAFSKAIDFQESRLARGDGSYLGIPWHAEESLPGRPDHPGYQVAFTLYAIEAMAAAWRLLGREASDPLSRSLGWLYRNFRAATLAGGPPLKRIWSPALRSLLLMPLRGFIFQAGPRNGVRVEFEIR